MVARRHSSDEDKDHHSESRKIEKLLCNFAEEIKCQITCLEKQIGKLEERIMAKFDDVQALVTALDTETTRIAAKVQELMDKIAGGLSAEEADTVNTELATLRDKLTAIGADPTNPIP